jgi:DNA polymerase epsilon subunit 1
MGYYFLYHLIFNEKEIFALFSTSSDQANIIIMNRKRDIQGLPNADKIYTDLRTSKKQEEKVLQKHFEYQESLHFKTQTVTTLRKAYTELGDALKRMQRDESKPMTLVMQSLHQRTLMHEVPILKELPILSLKADPTDNQLPPLGWQAPVIRRIMTNYLAFGSWITHLVELSRYGDVPLCNLEGDDNRFLIDIAYARRLQKNNIVLWWSPGSRPDHAGYEKDDVIGPMDKVDMPAINNSGTYSSVCVELEVRNLAVNTILTSSLVNELEGSESLGMNGSEGDGSGVLYSQSAFSSAGISTLREMVKAWWAEACRGSPMADTMVQHLIRWVESPSSYLYDRSLHYYVQMMSRKAFQQLMTDFKRVGSHVIFASSSRLLLQTTKAEVGNAYAYSQYILKSIKSKPLFNFLDLEIKEYWDYLIWYDEYNYGGKACQEVVETDEQPLETVMHWQFAAFLPKIYQKVFKTWVINFIELMHSLKRPQTTDDQKEYRLTQIPIRELTSTQDFNDQEVPKVVLESLKTEIGKPLKREITSLIKRYRAEVANPILAPDHEFPILPGSASNLSSTIPVLQLTKTIMHVYGLDKSLNLPVRSLRKDLLNLFEVREFSAEGRFENPSQKLLVEWSCPECTVVRELELCRDESLLPRLTEPGNEPIIKPWNCLHCSAPLPRNSIEEHLIAQVQSLIVAWSAQDLKCGKCSNIRIEAYDFMEHCPCSGVWVSTMNLKDVKERLRVTEGVAKVHRMKMLSLVIEEVLGAI